MIGKGRGPGGSGKLRVPLEDFVLKYHINPTRAEARTIAHITAYEERRDEGISKLPL